MPSTFRGSWSFGAPIPFKLGRYWWGDTGGWPVAKTGVRLTTEQAGNERKIIGQDVVVRSLGVLWSGAGSTIALVEIAMIRHVLEVFHKRSVEATSRSRVPHPWPQSITRPQPTCLTRQIRRIAGAFGTIDGKPIRRVPQLVQRRIGCGDGKLP